MLMLALPQAGLEVSDRWHVFELLVPHVIAVHAGFDQLIRRHDMQTWAEALPVLFGKSEIAKNLVFNFGPNPFA